MDGSSERRFNTLAVRGSGQEVDTTFHAHRIPIYQTSTFVFSTPEEAARRFAGEEEGPIYSRIANPTVDAVEERIALLEGAETGMAFASGLAAVHALVMSRTFPGANLVVQSPIYGGTWALLEKLTPHLGLELRTFRASEVDRLSKLVDGRTAWVLLEIPANPTLDVVDLERVVELAHKRGVPVAVDSTFATPYHLRPLAWGADVVIHSATKYLGGHGDLIGGLLAGSHELLDPVRDLHISLGGILSPWNAYLLLRGMRTLHVRMPRHSENARHIADILRRHPAVERVYYPDQDPLAQKYFENGFSGMVSFVVRGGDAAAFRLMRELRLILLSVSLGDGDTLITHPASTTHARVPEELRIQSGILPGFLRLSVGLEDVADIVEDLTRALAASQEPRATGLNA